MVTFRLSEAHAAQCTPEHRVLIQSQRWQAISHQEWQVLLPTQLSALSSSA